MPSPAPQQLEKVVIATPFASLFSAGLPLTWAVSAAPAGARRVRGPVPPVPPATPLRTSASPCFLRFAPNYVASIAVHLISCINVISFHIVKQLRAMIEFHSISLNKHAN